MKSFVCKNVVPEHRDGEYLMVFPHNHSVFGLSLNDAVRAHWTGSEWIHVDDAETAIFNGKTIRQIVTGE